MAKIKCYTCVRWNASSVCSRIHKVDYYNNVKGERGHHE